MQVVVLTNPKHLERVRTMSNEAVEEVFNKLAITATSNHAEQKLIIVSAIEAAKEEGRIQGRAQGRAQGIAQGHAQERKRWTRGK